MKEKPILLLFIFTCLSGSLIAQVPTNGLIGYWPFSGNAMDESGNGNNGIVHGATLASDRDGNTNSAYFFDGNSDYISIDPVSDVDEIGDFTISVWANCYSWERQPDIANATVVDQQYVFDGHSHSETVSSDYIRDGFLINYKLTDDDTKYIMNTIQIMESSSFFNFLEIGPEVLNNWHHTIFIRTGNESYHYINGQLIDKDNPNSALLNMQHKWFIGTFSGNNPNYSNFNYNFHGKIDDLIIYNRAIDSLEVQNLYQNESNCYETIPERMP